MFDITTLLILIPGLPLLATLVTAVFGAKVLRRQSHWPTVLGLGLSCVVSLILLGVVAGESRDKSRQPVKFINDFAHQKETPRHVSWPTEPRI